MSRNENIKKLISAYIDGETTVEETAAVQKSIRENAECKKYYEELQNVSSSLKLVNDESLSPDLEQKIVKNLLNKQKREGFKMKSTNTILTATMTGLCVALLTFVAVSQIYFKGVNRQYAGMERDLKHPVPELQMRYNTEFAKSNEKLEAKSEQERMQIAKTRDSFMPSLFKRGKLKQAADDIGGVYSAGNTDQIAMGDKSKPQISQKGLATSKTVNEGSVQYEPYYLGTDYNVGNKELASLPTAAGTARTEEASKRIRGVGGRQLFNYGEVGADASASVRSNGVIGREIAVEQEYWGGRGDVYYPTQPRIINIPQEYDEAPGTESYDQIVENSFKDVMANPLSTFSIDVDTSSYANVRRYLNNRQMPPKDAVRIEEMINYFTYSYPQPRGRDPFSINIEAAKCPWNTQHDLVMVGLQGKTLQANEIPPSNLVFLIDVSGSMSSANKLPLLKDAFRNMVNQLRAEDRVAIVTYAGSAGLVLQSTPGSQKHVINNALTNLHSGGSTAGSAGIQLAYHVARQNFIRGGNNRVILATDGDFNVGISNDSDLTRMIEQKRKEGVFLTVLGFGTGNYKDSKMEKLADKGNGNYAYIDNIREANKVLVNELGSMLFTIAKDVKLQLEFNPAQVKNYRLVGYENRMMAAEDFNDDTKDAGELGAGHTVTAIYEVIPASAYEEASNVDALKYQTKRVKRSPELLTVKLRYKEPEGFMSRLISKTLNAREVQDYSTSNNFNFASAVAEFGLLLRSSQYKGYSSYQNVLQRARQYQGRDMYGYRGEFIHLVETAASLDSQYIPEPVPLHEHPYEDYPAPMQFKGGNQ